MSNLDANPWSSEEKELFDKMFISGATLEEFTAAFPHRSKSAINNRYWRTWKRPQPGKESGESTKREANDFTEDSWKYEAETSKRITSLEDLVAFAKIDLDTWEIVRWTCNKWEVGAKDAQKKLVISPLWQIKAEMKKRLALIETRERIAEMVEDARQYAPIYFPLALPPDNREYLAIFNLADAHLGKLAWRLETGQDYDLKIAVDAWKSAILDLIDKIKAYPLERVLLIFGNDFLNSDNLANTTTRGTQQHNDVRFPKVYRKGRELLVWTIEQFRLVSPLIDVLMVPGNHDAQSTFTLGDSLECWFHNCDNVAIDNQPIDRKYYEFGVCMFCFAHGDEVKPKDLPLKMAVEEPEMWGRTLYREAQTGHIHHVTLQEIGGVYVRSLPSLSATDAWHFNNGFTGNRRGAEARIYHRSEGPIGLANHNFGTKAAA